MSRIPQPRSKRGSQSEQPPREMGLPRRSGQTQKTTHEARTTVGQPQVPRSNLPRLMPSTQTPGANVATSCLQKRIFKEALTQAAAAPKGVHRAMGAEKRQIRPPTIMTRHGPEKVIKQAILEQTVQRSPLAEYISQTVTGIETAPSGNTVKYEITSQQIDPTHATESAGVNQTVSVTSSLSVTAKGKQATQIFKRRIIKDVELANQLNKNPYQINRLVNEETEDVENTLKMAPPHLIGQQLENFPLRKKLHNLRLTSESMALLERSVFRPIPTADEVDNEAPPEVLAILIDAVDKGATPMTGPHQIFNTLFPEVKDDKIRVSTVVEVPLEDVVVPTETPEDHTEEILTEEMEDVIEDKIRKQMELPATDLVSSHEENLPEPPTFPDDPLAPNLDDEIPPWGEGDVSNISSLLGATPKNEWESFDISALETTEQFLDKLSEGMEYFLDAETSPYETRVQLRGTHSPPWFPGFMSAFPHIPEIVRVHKSPSEVLLQGWRAVQPKMFNDDSIVMV